MTEEKAIERLKDLIHTCDAGIKEHGEYDDFFKEDKEAIKTVLNMLKEKDKEIEKLKKHNKELLRKLRNRVKEVKKLNKYSLYKKEFKRLNEQIKKKDKMIDLIIDEYEYNERINLKDFCEDELRKDTCIQDCKTCIKQYFEQKSDKRRLIAIF